ncbi:hypothetical protein MAPG_10390 [Magnaporthiopsis poae ATCC 64411]|uniref:Secreted protein n=1 Tax=Magnaporthiopsis poae (strain ATCC 64411 / 73-15) TaxID=644358 RepID=A0A0C4ECG6_MAGP6|nr:hypothetical protein MAPG_10390 [Magnaporthiopsis poae ATCC 64411]
MAARFLVSAHLSFFASPLCCFRDHPPPGATAMRTRKNGLGLRRDDGMVVPESGRAQGQASRLKEIKQKTALRGSLLLTDIFCRLSWCSPFFFYCRSETLLTCS